MRDQRQVAPAGSDDADVAIGCLVGAAGGVIGDVGGAVALLVFHSDWLYREGDALGAIVGGLFIGWAVALIIAVIASLVLISLMSRVARETPPSSSTAAFNVVLTLVVPAIVAAGTLWLAASVNR